MFKRSLSLLTVFCVMFLLLWGCSKSNHDTLVLLGNEDYLKSIDDVYPKNYREEWPMIAPDYYYFNDKHEVEPKPNEDLFPPDMTGDYAMNLHYINGTFMVNFNGNVINVPGSDRTIVFTISNQNNSLSDFEFKVNNRAYPVDKAYIYGTVNPADSTKKFSLCFEYLEEYAEFNGTSMSVTYGCIITGNVEKGKESNVVKNGKCWWLIKDRYPEEETNYSFMLGGQQFFVAIN